MSECEIMKVLPLILAAVSASMPVVFQKTGLSEKYGFKMKMLCAFSYIVTGAVSAFSVYRVTAYSLVILTALLLGALGDFFLEYKRKKFFSFGVLFFAFGHIAYSFCFLCIGAYKALPHILTVIFFTAVLTLSVVILALTKIKLEGKKKLLLIYVPILIFAFACAFFSGVYAVRAGNLSYGLCLISGGILFFLSDIMIGIGKGGIQRPEFLHNAVSYTYFAAQTLFALSIYFQ